MVTPLSTLGRWYHGMLQRLNRALSVGSGSYSAAGSGINLPIRPSRVPFR